MLLQSLFNIKEIAQCSLFRIIFITFPLTACTSNQSRHNEDPTLEVVGDGHQVACWIKPVEAEVLQDVLQLRKVKS